LFLGTAFYSIVLNDKKSKIVSNEVIYLKYQYIYEQKNTATGF